ncbi:hypothetical protein [Paraclostridium bifermentans]|uniref:hypothetical protein n=1 Tax=Paraclostridium bifermentans TaxID=1490 RepID=UPI00189E6DF1|nr:hypothetical protein [Paraclostridium bifermentans]
MKDSKMKESANQKSYLICNLRGFDNVTIDNNKEYIINNNIIKLIKINDDLKNIYVELQDGITYKEYHKEINNYLYHICFNLIVRTNVSYNIPVYSINVICENSKNIMCQDRLNMHDSIEFKYNEDSTDLYNKIINFKTSIDSNFMKYERIFKTLHNPNNIAQFMSLYQFLMELLQKNRPHISQKSVIDYLNDNKDKYDFLYFKPTRRTDKTFDEDCFTYIRNEIGHSEQSNDINLYKQLGSQITQRLIKNLLIVINDVIIDA